MHRNILTFAVATALSLAAAPLNAAHIPTQVPYQGTLYVDGAPVMGGTEDLTFFIVADPTDGPGAALWTETHTAVPVTAGRFSVTLGTVTPFPDGFFARDALYVGVLVGVIELTGRQRLLPVPYAVEAQSIPPGTLLPYAGTTAPAGWMLCAGQSLLVADYTHLWDAIGYTYGGSGADFSLPDLRGRMPMGKDDMGGASANRVAATQADNLGQGSGQERTADTPAHTHTTPDHNHRIRASCDNTPVCNAGGDGFTRGASNLDWATFGTVNSSNGPNDGGGTSGSTGAAATVNNMPPYLTVNYLIKL